MLTPSRVRFAAAVTKTLSPEGAVYEPPSSADDLHQRVKLRLALLVVRQHGENFVAKLKGQARFAADNLPRVQRGVDQRLRPLAGHISVLRQRAGENQREAQEQSQKKRVGLFHGSTSLSIGHNDAKQRQTWDLSASL